RRRLGKPARRFHIRRHGRAPQRAAEASGIVRLDRDRTAADLRARQGRRLLRRAGGPCDYTGWAGQGLPLVAAGSRRGEQPPVSDEDEGADELASEDAAEDFRPCEKSAERIFLGLRVRKGS